VNRKRKITIALVISCILVAFGGKANANFIFGEPVNLGPKINSAFVDASNCTSADHLELYFCSNRPGGFGDMDIWVSTRQNIDDPWESPVNLGSPINSQYVEAYPSLSSDGLTLYFSDLYSGTPRPGGVGGADIWMTTRTTRSDRWKTPVNLGAPVNSSAMEISPSVSGDGLILVFASSRSGTSGPYDLWMSTRSNTQDPWDPPVNLGASVNGMYGELECSLSADGLAVFFASGRPGGLSQYDLWMNTRKSREDLWAPTVNVGPVVNSASTEGAAGVSSDMKTLYFDSDRPGGFGSYDLWEASIIPVVDFNADGIFDIADIGIMVDNWHTHKQLCDIGPAPWGDGIVDVQDMIVLTEYMLQVFLVHWELDEMQGSVAYDSAGDHNGTLNGNPLWQPTSGIIAGALEFDGIDDYISTDFVLDPSWGAFSVFAWIKGGAPGQVIISQLDGIGTGGVWLGMDELIGNLVTGLVPSPLGRFKPTPLESEFVITDGQWHHIGFVWDGSYRSLYVAGIEVAKDTNAFVTLNFSTGGLYIGASKDLDAGTLFSGLIDDVRIYNRAVRP
jgi:hypothetical protein